MPNTYTDTPIASHTLAADQPNMEANFLYLANTLGTSLSATKDHQISVGGVDTASFEGRHLSVSLKNKGLNPAHPGDGTDSYLWSNGGNVWGRNTTSSPILLTYFQGGQSLVANNGFTSIAGIMIQYGSATKSTDGIVTFGTPFPNNLFNVQVTMLENNNNRHFVFVKTIALNQFTVASRDSGGNDESNTFYWMALGN